MQFLLNFAERLPSTNLIDLNCEVVAPLPSQSRIHEYINDMVTDDTKTNQPRDVFDMRKYKTRLCSFFTVIKFDKVLIVLEQSEHFRVGSVQLFGDFLPVTSAYFPMMKNVRNQLPCSGIQIIL